MEKNASVFVINKVWIWVSGIIAALATITSLLGIFSTETYSRELDAWAAQAVGQDWANLIAVVILIFSTQAVAKGSLKGYLIWLGTFMYFIYAFAIYSFSVHFQFLFLAYVIIFGLSIYALISGLSSFNLESARQALTGNQKAGAVSVLLYAIGILFVLLWLSEIIPHLIANTVPQSLIDTGLWTNPVHVLDLGVLLPAMIVTATWLRRKQIWGYILAVPLLIFSITMGLGIIILFIISALNGFPYSLPGGVIIGLIVLFSDQMWDYLR